MYFKKIEMQGFKSFAEPVTIEFNDGITCIVGPNGSGKSNISDAIRWVLGEQSPKTLRGGKMEDVIFAGTASRKSRGMAEVTLVIDNEAKILPIDFSEVSITRRMYRSGESEYSINGSACRLRDIRELIMDTGIGVDGYSLIGQGRIADIVSNKSESRREIFEESAGIVKYRSRKNEAERKLETAAGNLERVNDIIAEIEGRIGNLKEESEKAREYLALRERYRDLEINITLKNIENLEVRNEYVKDEISEAAAETEELREEKSRIETALSEGNARSRELDALNDSARDKLMIVAEQRNALVNRTQVNREKLGAMGKDDDRLGEEIAGLSEKLIREENAGSRLAQELASEEESLRDTEQALEAAAACQEAASGRLTAETAALEEARDRIYRLHSGLTAKETEKNSLAGLGESLERRREAIFREQEEAEAAGGDALLRYEALRQRKEELDAALPLRREEERAAREKWRQDQETEKKLRQSLEEINLELGRMAARKKTIEEMENNYEGYGAAVRFLMKAGLRGIEGLVADRIRVPAGYETAVETALGPALQNVICRSDEDAKKAVALLKEQKAGRLTFLPIGSVRPGPGKREAELSEEPGFLGYGVSCIEFDEKYQEIMEYLLGRVVIVDHLDHAVRLSKKAKGGLRFVTMEGDVINAGGAITGGAYRNKTASLLERKNEIARLEEGLRRGEEEKAGLLKRQEALVRGLEAGQERIRAAGDRLRETEMELISVENRKASAEEALGGITAGKERWAKELSRIQEETGRADRMIRELEEAAEAAREEIRQAGEEAERLEKSCAACKSALEEAGEAVTAARLRAGACQNRRDHLVQALRQNGNLRKELSESRQIKEAARRQLAKEKEEILSGHRDLDSVAEEKEKEQAAIEAYIGELAEERRELAERLQEENLRREEKEKRISELQTVKYELEIRLARNETQLDNYKNKLWEEFETSYIKAIEFRKKDFQMGPAVRESRELRGRMKELGEVNTGAIKEYEAVGERYEFLTAQRADIVEAVDGLNRIIEDLDRTIRTRFKESFDRTAENFGDVFQELFGGGQARLLLEDESRPLESGIEIVAQPPGKKLQNINLLSGGEKTMTAIALMFAVLRAKPTPFCILDEVEAALDDANIDRFARYLKNFREIQFALVTHQRATMEHADVLYGVTMPEQGISKVISLRLEDKFDL